MSDKELFEALDLAQPALAAVREAWAAGDTQLAKARLVEHFKTRARPRWLADYSRPGPHAPGFDTAAADRVLRHEMTSVDYTHKFEGPIDWELDPINYLEWPWQLNRHQAWVDLAQAYWATGEERYAHEFVAQMTDWLSRYPAPAQVEEETRCWRTIEAGIRMGLTWPQAWCMFVPSPHFAGAALLTMLKSVPDHVHLLMLSRRTGNWLAIECSGQFAAGVLFPEFRQAAEWREKAVTRLQQHLEERVYPDGAQVELSTLYHQVSLGFAEQLMRLAERNGIPMPADYRRPIERMYEFNLMMAAPDLTLPPLGDADRLDARGYLSGAAARYPDRQDFLYLASDRKEGKAPEASSWAFPYAGYYVMRTGWGAGDSYLLFDGGPFGFGHQHEDMLHFVLYADGHWHVVDPGRYVYDGSPMRRYMQSARGHNTVLVDGLEQNRRRAGDAVELVREPLPHEWHTDELCDYAAAVYGWGFGPEGQVRVRHERAVFFLKPEYWVVLDRLEPEDAREHRYQALVHLDDEVAVQGSRAGALAPNGSRLEAFLSAPRGWEGLTVVSGQKEPVVQGWLHQRAYECRPIPTLVAAVRGAGVVRLATVLYPVAADQECPVRDVQAEQLERGVRVRVLFRNGRVDEVYRADDQDGPLSIGHDQHKARLVYRRTAPDGGEALIHLVGGQALH